MVERWASTIDQGAPSLAHEGLSLAPMRTIAAETTTGRVVVHVVLCVPVRVPTVVVVLARRSGYSGQGQQGGSEQRSDGLHAKLLDWIG